MAKEIEYGLLLQHFGEQATLSGTIDAAEKAESYGFDSVWVRDHILFEPHPIEGPDQTFVEPFTVLSAASAVTDTINLGTLVTIPVRHPLHLTKLYSSLSFISDDRAVAGIGAGAFEKEFKAVGLPFEDRAQLIEENLEIMNRVWNEDDVDYDGEIFSFEDVELLPMPGEIPIWIGGKSPAAMHRAIEYGDGWNPGRVTFETIRKRTKQLHKRSEERGRAPPKIGVLAPTSIDDSFDEAYEKTNVDEIVEYINGQKWQVKPDGDELSSFEDIRGALLLGSPEDIVEDIKKFKDIGVEKIVFDLRHRSAEYDYCLDMLGEEVLPHI